MIINNTISSEDTSRQLTFSFQTDSNQLVAINSVLESLADELAWPAEISLQLELVLEELVTNIINHGYKDGRLGHVDVCLNVSHNAIHIKILDDGDPFNPFAAESPDLSLSIEERPIGGLGIHLIRSYMTVCEYGYENGHNQVLLMKNW
jgi:anti-sigma regulatory factor (Ser/Thr protein kinase)